MGMTDIEKRMLKAGGASIPESDIERRGLKGVSSSTPDLSNLPVRVSRAVAAELLNRYFFETSPRTLERWPLTWQLLNGKAHCNTAQLFAVAAAKLAAAPVIMGGRRQETEEYAQP